MRERNNWLSPSSDFSLLIFHSPEKSVFYAKAVIDVRKISREIKVRMDLVFMIIFLRLV